MQFQTSLWPPVQASCCPYGGNNRVRNPWKFFPKARSIISADGHDPGSWYFAAGGLWNQKGCAGHFSMWEKSPTAKTAKRNSSSTPGVYSGGAELWVSCQAVSRRETPWNPCGTEERACFWVLGWWSIVPIYLDYINKIPVSLKLCGQVLVCMSLEFLLFSLLGKQF